MNLVIVVWVHTPVALASVGRLLSLGETVHILGGGGLTVHARI